MGQKIDERPRSLGPKLFQNLRNVQLPPLERLHQACQDMKAVILAGGKGRRLAPYATTLPKPLLPVGEMPILEILLIQLKSFGITDISLCVGYLGSLIQAYFGPGERYGMNIEYSFESQPLGTAGPLKLIEGLS